MKLRIGIIPAVFLFVLMTGQAVLAADSLTFRFDPPIDKVFWEVSEQHATDSVNGIRDLRVYLVQQAHYSRTGDDLRLVIEADTVSISRNGAAVAEPVIRLMSAAGCEARLDTNGMLLSAEIPSLDSLFAKFGIEYDSEPKRRLSIAMSSDAITKKVKEEWGFYVEQFSGRTLAVGDSLQNATDYEVPGIGTMHMSTTIVLDSLAPCAADSPAMCACLRYFSAAADSGSFGAFFDSLKSGSGAADATPPFSGLTQVTNGEMRVDPRTLLRYSDHQIRVVTITLRGSPAGVLVKRSEKFSHLSWTKP